MLRRAVKTVRSSCGAVRLAVGFGVVIGRGRVAAAQVLRRRLVDLDALGRGESYIKHLDATRVAAAAKAGTLAATTDFSRLGEPDAILICVPTPLTPQREPDMSYVVDTTRAVKEQLRRGQLVVLEGMRPRRALAC